MHVKMGKTLYIQIDSNSLPKGCGEDVEVLDCCCINDFCSLLGDALVGDLKDENGKPFYRLINPVGKLLMDFKEVDEKIFNTIIEKWYDILGNILHKSVQNVALTIQFPQQYIDWLIRNESPYFEQIGKDLLKNNGIITLSPDDIVDDIIASLIYKVSYFLKDNKKNISFVVLSNPLIRNSSFIIKRVKFEGIEFLRYDSWKEHIIKRGEKGNVQDEILTINGVSFKMIHIEGGSFTMGATSEQICDAIYNEKPAHRVTLSSFFLGETEVTQALWLSVMGCNPSKFQGADRPVEKVSWEDCQIFISKLNSLTAKSFRLPTEAEWEFAARGGNKSMGYKYSGSNDLSVVAWYKNNSGKETHDVKTKVPNELGLYDMNGNVREWCLDRMGDYISSSQTNPMSAGSGSCHVLRGGGWCNSADACRVSSRYDLAMDRRYGDLGLRLALSPHNSDSVMNVMMEAGKLLAEKKHFMVSDRPDDINIDDIPTSLDRI